MDVLVDGVQSPDLGISSGSVDTTPPIELSTGVTGANLGALALQPELGADETFGVLEEPAEVKATSLETDDRDLLGEVDPAPEQISHASRQPDQVVSEGAPRTSEPTDARHGFLSFFADRVEAGDPSAAAKIREYRDEGAGSSEKGERTATDHCGTMSDLIGMEDADGPFGGFLRDLSFILPGGRALFETPYHTACREWFEQHRGMDY